MLGKFIVFDGIDGCGKTAQMVLAADFLYCYSKEHRILLTREPTMEKHGLELRKLLSQTNSTQSTGQVFELFVKDRRHHLNTVVNPALERGHIVLCDRHKYSTLAYQGAGGEAKDKIVDAFKDFRKPDLALIFDVSPKTGLERAKKDLSGSRQKKLQGLRLFEQEGFLEKARQIYLECQKYFPLEKIRIIDGSRPKEDIFVDVKRELESIL